MLFLSILPALLLWVEPLQVVCVPSVPNGISFEVHQLVPSSAHLYFDKVRAFPVWSEDAIRAATGILHNFPQH